MVFFFFRRETNEETEKTDWYQKTQKGQHN